MVAGALLFDQPFRLTSANRPPNKKFWFAHFLETVCRKRGRLVHIYYDHDQLLTIFVFNNSCPTTIFSLSI
jgi:hypothetical protein